VSKYGTLASLSMAIVIASAEACPSRERVNFTPPPQWTRASVNVKLPFVVGIWFPPYHPGSSLTQSITLQIVPLPERVRAGAVVTGMLKRDPTVRIVNRRPNARCTAGTSEVVNLRSDAYDINQEMVATGVHGALYLATYARRPLDRLDKMAVNAVESMCPV
jgi:hypothetical protein